MRAQALGEFILQVFINILTLVPQIHLKNKLGNIPVSSYKNVKILPSKQVPEQYT